VLAAVVQVGNARMLVFQRIMPVRVPVALA
jgi:hypothetical protein